MQKLLSMFANKHHPAVRPCAVKTVGCRADMDFREWQKYIEEEAVITELKNAQSKFDIGSKGRFLRNLSKTIIEANILV